MKHWVVYLSLYLIGMVLCWTYNRIAYSKRGVNYGSYPGNGDIFITLMPILNLILGLFFWIMVFPVKKTLTNRSFANLFFGIKKNEI